MGLGRDQRRVGLKLGADAGYGVGVLLLQECDELLADQTAKVPGSAGVASAHQGAQLDGVFLGVGDLHVGDFAAPQLAMFDDLVELATHRVDGTE